jgi:ribulose-phosphate 3-epimerase
MIQDRGLSTLIQIDGGVSRDTIEEISLAGVDSFVTGSALFGSQDYKATLSYFRDKTKN